MPTLTFLPLRPIFRCFLGHTAGTRSSKHSRQSHGLSDTDSSRGQEPIFYQLAPRPGQPGYKPPKSRRIPRNPTVVARMPPVTRKNNKAARAQNVRAPNAQNATTAELETAQEQVRILQAQLAAAQAQAQSNAQNAQNRVIVVRTVTKKPEHLHFQSDYAKVIEDIVRIKAWRFFKYLPENEDQARLLCASVLSELKKREEKCVKEVIGSITTPAQEIAWIEENRYLIAKKINDKRASVAASMKGAFKEYWSELEKPKDGAPDTRELPKVEDFLKVALRKSSLESGDKSRDLALLWVDRVLPKAAGHHMGFHSDHRHRFPISKCEVDGIPLMTSSTEAFALVAFANYRECWAEHFKLKEKYKGKLQPMPKNHPKEATAASKVAGYTFVEGNKKLNKPSMIYMHHPRYFAKWTEQDAGARKEGAWKDEGRDLFNTYVAKIDAARAHKRCAKWEAKMLDVLAEEGAEDLEKAEKTGPPAKKKRRTSANGGRDNISMAMAASCFGIDLSEYGGDGMLESVGAGADDDSDCSFVFTDDEEAQEEQGEEEEPDVPEAQQPQNQEEV